MEWREIPGYRGFKVNEVGQIRGPSGKDIKVKLCKHGYPIVLIRYSLRVHRAVLLAFEGEPEIDCNVGRHLDGNKINNSRDNLKWGTHKENSQDAIRHRSGAVIKRKNAQGEHNCRSKLTESQVREIKTRASTKTETNKQIAEDYPVSYGIVNRIISGEKWSHVII